MLQRARRSTASEKHTVILGSVSTVVSHTGLRRGGCKSSPAKVRNDSAVEVVHLCCGHSSGWNSTLPGSNAPLRSGVHRLQVRSWRGGLLKPHSRGPHLCLVTLWRCVVQTDTDSFDVRRSFRLTSRFRAHSLFSWLYLFNPFIFTLFSVIV